MQFGTTWLRITRRFDQKATSGPVESEDTAINEDDEEALPPATVPPKQPLVVYDIAHSPSYQVPVLYITFRDLASPNRGLPSPGQVYELLVPSAYRTQVDSVGTMGALSMTDHPTTATPAYFVHPCRTAEAMDAIAGGRKLRPIEYLLQWIGAIGQSVGLGVPLELARVLHPSSSMDRQRA